MAGSVTLVKKSSGSEEKSSGKALSKSLPAVPKFAAMKSWRVRLAGKPFASFGRALKLALTVEASCSSGKSLHTQHQSAAGCDQTAQIIIHRHHCGKAARRISFAYKDKISYIGLLKSPRLSSLKPPTRKNP